MNLFSAYSQPPDVELLMQQVEQKLQQWENGKDLGPFRLTALPFGRNDADSEQMIGLLSSQWDINGRAIIHSTRPVLSRPIIVFQRVIRRLTWWYLEPLLQQIRDFHLQVAKSVSYVFRRQQAQSDEFVELVQEQRRLEQIVLELSQRLATLEEKSGEE